MSADEPRERAFVELPATEIDRDELDRIADHAARRFGSGEPIAVRISMNGVYRCPAGIIRVARTTAPAEAALALARLLTEAGVAVAQPLSDEVVVDDSTGCSATLWAELADDGSPVDWRMVGESIARVHALSIDVVAETYPLPSPSALPWWEVERVLDRVDDLLDPVARRSIDAVIERTRPWSALVARDPVVCHGDLHPGNVISTPDGPVLIDWDLLCRAHSGWDHAPLIGWTRVWGGDRSIYDSFCAGYGTSLIDDPTTGMITDLRLIVATLMRLEAGRHRPEAAAEASRRLDYWRTGVLERPWIAQ